VKNLQVGALTAIDPVPDGPRTPPLYSAYDDVDSFYAEHPHYEWIELKNRGSQLTFDDDETQTFNLPPLLGGFRYYGQSYSQVSICSNGWIAPGTTSSTEYDNTELPSAQAPVMIAADWDDLYPPTGGAIWYLYDTTHHAFVVEWDSIPSVGQRYVWETFEIVIHDSSTRTPSGNNAITLQYKTARNFASSTVGLQDPTLTIGIQCLFNGVYHRASSEIVAGRAIRFWTDSVQVGLDDAGTQSRVLHLGLRAMPNPLRGASKVSLSIPVEGHVRLAVHDISGRKVRTLLDSEMKPGTYTVPWNRTDDHGRAVSAGIYVYRLETATGAINLKTVVVN
jgi:hypothetical protein